MFESLVNPCYSDASEEFEPKEYDTILTLAKRPVSLRVV